MVLAVSKTLLTKNWWSRRCSDGSEKGVVVGVVEEAMWYDSY